MHIVLRPTHRLVIKLTQGGFFPSASGTQGRPFLRNVLRARYMVRPLVNNLDLIAMRELWWTLERR